MKRIIRGRPERLTLSWPPSVNHYWENNKRGGKRIGAAGKAFRAQTWADTLHVTPFGKSRLSVEIVACPPDRRRRDLDNTFKAILDALENVEVFDDDGQIDHLEKWRGPVVPGGQIVLLITELIEVDEVGDDDIELRLPVWFFGVAA